MLRIETSAGDLPVFARARIPRPGVSRALVRRMVPPAIGIAACLGTAACNSRATSDREPMPDAAASISQAADVRGTWHLEAVPPNASPGSMRLTIHIDSVVGRRVYGYLVDYFVGDVGSDSSAFPDFQGEMREDAAVSLVIRSARQPAAAFRLVGTPSTDAIPLALFVVGPDTLSGERRWRLVRTPR